MEFASCSWLGRTLFPAAVGRCPSATVLPPRGHAGHPALPSPLKSLWKSTLPQITRPPLLLQLGGGSGRKGLPDLCCQAVNLQCWGEGGLREGFWVLLLVFILSFGGGLGIWSGRKLPLSGVQCHVLCAFISSLCRGETASSGARPATGDWSCRGLAASICCPLCTDSPSRLSSSCSLMGSEDSKPAERAPDLGISG